MPIPLKRYAEIKNKYCICYFGPTNEYVVQLVHLRPYIETMFPGIEIYIGCKNSLEYLVKGMDRIVWQSEIEDCRKDFAHIRELRCNLRDHPVYEFLKESGLENLSAKAPYKDESTKRCVLCPIGILPTKTMPQEQIQRVTRACRARGYEVLVQDKIDGAGWVVGVESEALFLAASKGIQTTLIPTGPGDKLYKLIASKDVPMNL